MKEKQKRSDKGKKEDKHPSKSKNSKRLVQLYRTGLRGYSLVDDPREGKFEK
ncbi:hypothetical protein [Sphingobacterium faecale]|uniref:Uncharacterized protein n=1 Tax=Sphingobacterium faecale TaxID=2803775 RepID=A0ABS1R2P0_9SPHI|nr:hypothetical protein [Sphingobacterium faecale]MBL1408965.1 hypothetical protein [Sphingobacterium faecale]